MANIVDTKIQVSGEIVKLRQLEKHLVKGEYLEGFAPLDGEYERLKTEITWGTKCYYPHGSSWEWLNTNELLINVATAWSPPFKALQRYFTENPDMKGYVYTVSVESMFAGVVNVEDGNPTSKGFIELSEDDPNVHLLEEKNIVVKPCNPEMSV